MNIENKILVYSMINNLLIAIIKIIGSFTFGLGSLLADGMHTFSDFVTDIVSLIGSKISKKKPTKYHPFGFGKVEYLTNLFVGIILFSLGIYIVISSFMKEVEVPSLYILVLLFVAFILKGISILIMNKVGEKINSQLLITAVKESKVDLYSSFGVVIITILLQFSDEISILKYSDLVGSILIGIIVLKTSFSILIDNSLALIGEVEENEEITLKVKNLILEEKGVEDAKVNLIKYGPYYNLQLTLSLDPKLSLKQVIKLEKSIKKLVLRKRTLKIKYVTIYIMD